MILDTLILLSSSILFVLIQLMQGITFVIPNEINDSVNYILGYFGYIQSIFPVEVAFTALGIYLNFILLYYTFKIAKWVYSILPFFGRVSTMPSIDRENVVDLSNKSNVVNLRGGRFRGFKGRRNTKDIL